MGCEGDRKDEEKGKGDKSLVSQVVEDEERTKFDDVGNDVRQMEASAENHRKLRGGPSFQPRNVRKQAGGMLEPHRRDGWRLFHQNIPPLVEFGQAFFLLMAELSKTSAGHSTIVAIDRGQGHLTTPMALIVSD